MNSVNNDQLVPPRKKRLKKWLFIGRDMVAIAAVLGGIWWWHINRVPNLTVSLPSVPSPNGYDLILTAAHQLKDKDVVNDFNPNRGFSLAEKEHALVENAPVRTLIRQALALPVQVPIPSDQKTSTIGLIGVKDLARFLTFAGKVEETQGDFRVAADSYLDAIELGVSLPKNGCLTVEFVGVACESLGKYPLIGLVDKLSAEDARAVGKRLAAIERKRVPFSEKLTVEKTVDELAMLKLFQTKNVVEVAQGFARESDNVEAVARAFIGIDDERTQYDRFVSSLQVIAQVIRTSKTDVLAEHARIMNAMIAEAKQPYGIGSQTIPQPKAFLNQVIFPLFEQARFRGETTHTSSLLLLTKIALHAWKLEQGSYPDSLEKLVAKGYMVAMPADPFGRSSTAVLHYRRKDPSEYFLYSVGPDGKDDGGSPIPERYSKGRVRVEPASKGDFFSGIGYIFA